jgi:hypothetical protein
MKTENTKETHVSAKTKASIKTLKLAKETIEKLADQDAGAIKGGGRGGPVTI